MVRGLLTAIRVSMAARPAARRSFSSFSKAATSGLLDQMVGWDTEMFWADRIAARNSGRAKIMASRAASNMKEPRGNLSASNGCERYLAASELLMRDSRDVKRGRKNSGFNKTEGTCGVFVGI